MTDAAKFTEIGQRLMRLNELRADFVVANAKLKKLADDLGQARIEAGAIQAGNRLQSSATWPTSDEFHAANGEVDAIRKQAREIIDELKGLGCHPDLFKFGE